MSSSESDEERGAREWLPPGMGFMSRARAARLPPGMGPMPSTSRERSSTPARAPQPRSSCHPGPSSSAGERSPPRESNTGEGSLLPLMSMHVVRPRNLIVNLRPSPLDPGSQPRTLPGAVTNVRPATGPEPQSRRRRFRAARRPNNTRACPICDIIPTNLRQHAEAQHLPFWLRLEAACDLCGCVFPRPADRQQHTIEHHQPRNEEALALRWLLATRSLVLFLSNTIQVPVDELPAWIGRNQLLPEATTEFGCAQAALLRDLALMMGFPAQGDLSPARPINPVEVLHWRTLLLVSNHMTVGERSRLRSLPLPENNDGIPLIIPDPPAVDAHCHLTVIYQRRGRDDAYQTGPFRRQGIVNNLVFPNEWDAPPTNDTSSVTSMGIHPNMAGRGQYFERLQARLEEARFIGECGLDTVRGPEAQEDQEILLRKQVRLAIAGTKVLILHLRGDLAVIQRAQAILIEERVPPNHPIYLHCFTGDMETYEAWVRLFPNSAFGVSPVTITTPAAEEFCRRADLSRILLESDAPYLGSRAYDLLPQADYLATLRHLSRRAVLGATAHAATKFFFH